MEKRTPVQKSIIRHKLKEIDRKWSHMKVSKPSQSKALDKAKEGHKIPKKPIRYLTEAESQAKRKALGFPTGKHHEPNHKEKVDYQKRTGKAYSE